jgi:hypothetical protein
MPLSEKSQFEDVRTLISRTASRQCSTAKLRLESHTCAEVLHAALAFGPAAKVFVTGNDNRVSLLEILERETIEGLVVRQGSAISFRASRFPHDAESHRNQFLAYAAMMGVPKNAIIRCEGESFSIQAMLAASKSQLTLTHDHTYSIIAYVLYEPDQLEWRNEDGRRVDLRELIRAELGADRSKQACAGTHSLFALAAVRSQSRSGHAARLSEFDKPIDTVLTEALRTLQRDQETDGSFRMPVASDSGELHGRAEVLYTGHSLEWIAVYLDLKQLDVPWIKKALIYLCRITETESFKSRAGTAEFHALHALRIFADAPRGALSGAGSLSLGVAP